MKNSKNDLIQALKDNWLILVGIIIVMVLASFIALVSENSNTFGDSFGWVNALFSGLAFFGLIVTLQMQREELKQNTEALDLQAKELEATRGEIEKQSDEFKTQSLLIEQQGQLLDKQIRIEQKRDAENLIFRTLEMFQKAREEVKYNILSSTPITGARAFEYHRFLPTYLEETGRDDFGGSINAPVDTNSDSTFEQYINEEAHRFRADAKPYFNQLRNLYKTLDQKSELSLEYKLQLSNIIRDSFTQHEIAANLLNAISHDGRGMRRYFAYYDLGFYLSGSVKNDHYRAVEYYNAHKEEWLNS